MRALLHEAGQLDSTDFFTRVGVSQVHFYLALRPLLASGEIVRDGPKNGPGATYRLATTGKDGDAHEAAVSRKHGARPDDTTAPAEIPPAAPPPIARDRVRAPALTLRGKVRKQRPRTVAEIVGGIDREAERLWRNPEVAPTIPGQIVLDMLREAGAAGEKPSRLRVESGLEPMMFRTLMQTLMETGTVVREREAHGPADSVRYRLKEHAQRALANAAPVALDGREKHGP